MLTKIFRKLFNSILSILIISVFISCKNEKKDKTLEAAEEKTEETSTTTSSFSEEKVYDDIIQGFIDCKSSATERSHCRNEITKIISERYNLSEFKNSEGEYVIYDSIQPIIKRSEQWKNIGLATNQENLNKALEHTNNDGLSLIIDTANSYGHVVMLVPSEAVVSGSWGLKLPNVISLLNSQADKSFNDKPLSFAFKKSDDLHVFIKEK